jgi:hypothetical protein
MVKESLPGNDTGLISVPLRQSHTQQMAAAIVVGGSTTTSSAAVLAQVTQINDGPARQSNQQLQQLEAAASSQP